MSPFTWRLGSSLVSQVSRLSDATGVVAGLLNIVTDPLKGSRPLHVYLQVVT